MHTQMIEQNIKHMLPRQDENGRFRGLILSGRGGIGKTSLGMNLIPNAKLVRLTMATRSFENFGTYPCPIKNEVKTEQGTTQKVELKNLVIEEELLSLSEEVIGDEYAVFLLDDITLGDERLQSAILELVQFGKIGDVTLGKNVLPVLTGNSIQDKCFATEWSKALLGRCNLIHFEPNFQTWLTLPCNEYIEPSVVAFLSDNENFFAPEVDDDKCVDQHGKAPCPGDWTAIGNFFSEIGGFDRYVSNLLYKNAASFCRASVGDKAGAAYASYVEIFGVYPSTEELFNNPDCWKSVDRDKRRVLSGAMGVSFGVRSYAIRLLKKAASDKSNKSKKAEIVNQLWDVIKVIADDHSEIVAFVFCHLLNWACSEDISSGGLIAERLAKEGIEDPKIKTLMDGYKAYNASSNAA